MTPAAWRDKYKSMEQSWMVLRDQYSEIARALGFAGDSWFGDPLVSHEEIVARAKALGTSQALPRVCPWENSEPDGLSPEDPCPVCGMLGTVDAENKCIDSYLRQVTL